MIRKLTQEEYNNAADLSYQVCMERNDFTQEGIETFKSFVYDTSLMNTLDIYGAFDNSSIDRNNRCTSGKATYIPLLCLAALSSARNRNIVI